ncbi:MAG: hypothetical protein HUJ25_08820 [Crocinitomicaceae bacterium]|nr:hypothetical protein [Crocinitomicaceae bacterium]
MRNLITALIVLLGMFGCSQNKEQNSDQIELTSVDLDGYWGMTNSQYKGEKTSSQAGCPTLDVSIEAIYQPHALGSHILIKDDSISFFRYPYEYYGTYKYEIREGLLCIESDYTATEKFSIQKTDNDVLILNFVEDFTSTCPLSSEAKYERFTPDPELINKLIHDSISCDSLTGKWWYLRKRISHGDGMDPTILNFPKGMPDSIFITQEVINHDFHKPFIALELDHRNVKLFFENPGENSFELVPENKDDKILFCNFFDYGETIDTIYRDIIYRRY